jgi:hypothetical protein
VTGLSANHAQTVALGRIPSVFCCFFRRHSCQSSSMSDDDRYYLTCVTQVWRQSSLLRQVKRLREFQKCSENLEEEKKNYSYPTLLVALVT